jgi:hypothetical protein
MLQSLDTLIAFIVILLTTSLLVTILVQMLSSAFALRGKNLGNALALTFQSIDPTIGKDAYKLAERILGDPRLSDSTFAWKRAPEERKPNQIAPWGWWSLGKGWQLAGDVRPNEIYELLNKISIDPKDALKAEATKVLGLLGVPDKVTSAASDKLSVLLTIADTIADKEQKAAIAAGIADAQGALSHLATNITHDIDDAEAALAKWFDAAHDRAQQWFQSHTHLFTIVCGVVLAFLLQLDAVEILKFVSTNAAARAALVASADKLVEKADRILEKNGSLLDHIYDTAKKQIPVIDLPKEVRSAATNSEALKKAIQDDAAHKVPPDFGAKYDAAEKEAIDAYYKERRAQMVDLTKGVDAGGFNLIPDMLGHRWGTYGETFCAHFWGMLVTAGLLSLGAPFWYNCLKDLTSLRPAVSKIIGKEKAAETKTKK